MLEISPLHLIKYLEFVFWRHFHVLKDRYFSSPAISGHRHVDKLTLRLVPSLQGEHSRHEIDHLLLIYQNSAMYSVQYMSPYITYLPGSCGTAAQSDYSEAGRIERIG